MHIVNATWIIDGCNVILRLGEPGFDPPGEQARRRQVLEEAVAAFGADNSRRLIIIYDGQKMQPGYTRPLHDERLTVTFVEPPEIADDLIYEHAARYRREGHTVRAVTSDQGLATSLRALEVDVVSAEAFGERLVRRRWGGGPGGRGGPPESPFPGGGGASMADIEAHFLDLPDEAEELVTRKRGPKGRGDGGPPQSVAATSLVSPPSERSERQRAAPSGKEQRKRKKEAGRRKHLRRMQAKKGGPGKPRRRH